MTYLLRRSKEDRTSPYLMHATPDGREEILALFQPQHGPAAQVCVDALNEWDAKMLDMDGRRKPSIKAKDLEEDGDREDHLVEVTVDRNGNVLDEFTIGGDA